MNLAIIPARGGSKGIPGKNLKLVAGRPLIAWSIRAALAAERVDRVVVSTDSEAIAEAARRAGAEVIRRPAELAQDASGSEDALLHVLDVLEERGQELPENIIFLQCTSPLTQAADIDGAVAMLDLAEHDTVVSVIPFHYFLWKRNAEENATGINHDKQVRPLRQEREPQFLETGAVYVMRTQGFRQYRHRFFGNTALYEMAPERCLEIDDEADLDRARFMMTQVQRQQRQQLLPPVVEAVVFDFDGVMTNNQVLVMQDGREAVLCSRLDGMGLHLLRKMGIKMAVISTESSSVVARRCEKLGVECIQGTWEKVPALKAWAMQHGVRLEHTVYMGNDVNDLGCLQEAGCGTVPADAVPEACNAADLILESDGGVRAVRELADLIRARFGAGVEL